MKTAYPAPAIDHRALSEVAITRTAARIETPLLQLYQIDDFMTAEECDALVTLTRGQLVPSEVTYAGYDPSFRTSSTCHLTYIDHPLVGSIDARIAASLGVDVSFSEPIQAQCYMATQQLKDHTDYFEPGSEEYRRFANTQGNRTWTFMVYLNDGMEGGGTHFTTLGQTFYPKKGSALIWNNLNPDGSVNANTLHCGQPVTAGEKFIITKWFRELAPEKDTEVPVAAHVPVQTTIDAPWQRWIDEALGKGCAPEELRAILVGNGFAASDIAEHFDTKVAAFSASAKHGIDYRALASIAITRSGQKVDTDRVQLYTLDHFMTPEECDTLVALSAQDLYPSMVGTGYVDSSHRTSRSYDLYDTRHPLIREIDNRMAERIGIHIAYSDITQIQHYAVGQEFKPHHDYFEPGTASYDKFGIRYGNRTWTFMVYLNDTPKGGATHFTRIDKSFYPQKGSAVIWNNLYADGRPNPDTLHCGQPVEAGTKVIITKWFREKCTLPMLLP